MSRRCGRCSGGSRTAGGYRTIRSEGPGFGFGCRGGCRGVLSRAELATILEHRSGSDFGSLTARVSAELLFATGVRVAELASLRDEDIDLTAGVITIVGKGSRQRRVYIPDSD